MKYRIPHYCPQDDLFIPPVDDPTDGYGSDESDTDLSGLYALPEDDALPGNEIPVPVAPEDNDCPDCLHSPDCDPSDELAATCDDGCYCGCSEEKCALDDYEIISDVLGSEKQLVKLYSTALCESAEQPLRDVIKGNLLECAADQYATFEFMQKRGMYETEQADEQKISDMKVSFPPLVD